MASFIKKFKVEDNFFGRYQYLIRDVVIPYQEKALKDEIPDAEKSHCIENFKLAAEKLKTGSCESEFYGMVFQDSDAAKWLEGAAYTLAISPDAELERRCDEIIDIIANAQDKDGYLNTYFTVKEPNKRLTNLEQAHELYCAGHMMEAAVAYADCTGKTKLLDVMCRMSDYLYDSFITNKHEGYPGHPEIELALMRMYRCTGNEKYYELAKHFVDVRGVDKEFYSKEKARNDWSVWGGRGNPDLKYSQCHLPVREQDKAVGHSVRAVYLYTAMADVARTSGDKSLIDACKRLWDNMTASRMYVTGGIGSAYEGEAFTADYHLPNDTAYAETCASIGLAFFANKMLDLEKDAKYADAMERAIYNTVLAGMQLDGQRFFYVNPLEIIPGVSGQAQTHRHTLPERPKWFACACCPPNVARLLPSIADYAWCMENDTVYSNLFIGGTLDLSENGGKIEVTTAYPYEGDVTYKFQPNMDKMNMTLAVRVPCWSKETVIFKNGGKINCEIKAGYAYITDSFTTGDEIKVSFDMSARRIYSNEKVNSNNGKVAFSRGPLVYCLEGADNCEDILSLRIYKDAEPKICGYDPNKLSGIAEIKIAGCKVNGSNELYSYSSPKAEDCELVLVPYYTWGNRGLNQMRVWIPEI